MQLINGNLPNCLFHGLQVNKLEAKLPSCRKTVIFADGCFWNGPDCRDTRPEQNKEYWAKKRERNVMRDQQVTETLALKGWKVVRIWECEIRKGGLYSKLQSIISP